MDKKPFNAQIWLNFDHDGQTNLNRANDDDFNRVDSSCLFSNYSPSKEAINSEAPSSFNPTQYFTKSLSHGLIGKNTIALLKSVNILADFVKDQFWRESNFNKAIKLAIYNDFITFADSQALHCPELENHQILWEHLRKPQSPFQKELSDFMEIYSFRVAVIYCLKLRFISSICKDQSISLPDRALYNPNFFLSQLFKKSSSTELNGLVIQSNHYTWFRPLKSMKGKLLDTYSQVELCDLFDLVRIYFKGLPEVMQETSDEIFSDKFSNALSGTNYKKLLNILLTNFPNWSKNLGHEKENHYNSKKLPEILSCKYVGSNLEELIISNSIRQLNSPDEPNIILYPEYFYNNLSNDIYSQICHEIFFLDSLTEISKRKQYGLIPFVCEITKRRDESKQIVQGGQISLFQGHNFNLKTLFDRIIIHLNQFPKNNAHFYLINQINSQIKYLKENGIIYIFSNKKLFVPSLSDKVEQLLQKLKFMASFDFSELKGKGEISSYLYVFKQKENTQQKKDITQVFSQLNNGNSNLDGNKNLKQPCLSFRFSGQIELIEHFQDIPDILINFFNNKKEDHTTLYQVDGHHGTIFEFYRDAIVDGRLINSSSKDLSKVTHPTFFKKLMKTCLPLNQFFYFEQLGLNDHTTHHQSNRTTKNLLGLMLSNEQKFENVLIINLIDHNNPSIEITSMEGHKSKIQKYGTTLFHYFGMIPKLSHININLFREFFKTKLSLQLIQLSLSGRLSKIKGRLDSLLVPRFFMGPEHFPEHLKQRFHLLGQDQDHLLNIDPQLIHDQFNSIKEQLPKIGPQYPWNTMGLLTYFKSTVQNIREAIGAENTNAPVNYNNPKIIGPLLKSDSYPIYPSNDDFYIEFLINNPQEIHVPLQSFELKTTYDGTNHYLQLNGNLPVVKIYSDIESLKFLQFLLNSALSSPISNILQNIRIPRLDVLKEIISSYNNSISIYDEIYVETSNIINQLIKECIVEI